jgi:hypothetical protein
MEWLDEKVPRVERGNWLYNIVCFFTGKRRSKMSYKELFVFLYGLNRNTIGEKEAKQAAIIKVIEIYKYLHNGEEPRRNRDDDE